MPSVNRAANFTDGRAMGTAPTGQASASSPPTHPSSYSILLLLPSYSAPPTRFSRSLLPFNLEQNSEWERE